MDDVMTISGSNNLIFVLIVTGGMGMSSASDAQGYNPVTQQAQSRLASLGDNPGTLDGVLGSATVDAIRAFQTRSGLPATGTLDGATLERLGIGTSVDRDAVEDWIPVPTQEQLDRLMANPANDPGFPYTDYRPNAPAANLDLPGAAILAAMNRSADEFGSRRRGQPNHTDSGYSEMTGCLRTGFRPTHWSDVMLHYYCQMSLATRTCYSGALIGRNTPSGRIYPRLEAYQACATGTLPNSADFAWVTRTQPQILQYVTFAQTHAFNHEQEQAIINAFYGIRNPADRNECREKRPLRTEDPTDGTHCLVNKTMPIRLVGRGR
jgi:Putative peptidoglycan binding domain